MCNCFGLKRKKDFLSSSPQKHSPCLFTAKAFKCIFVGHLVFSPIYTGYEVQRLFTLLK